MALLALLSRALLVGRLLGLGRNRYRGRGRQGRGGFYGPFPYYSRRTRGGSRVTVSGCCLPIPLALLASVAAAVRLFAGR